MMPRQHLGAALGDQHAATRAVQVQCPAIPRISRTRDSAREVLAHRRIGARRRVAFRSRVGHEPYTSPEVAFVDVPRNGLDFVRVPARRRGRMRSAPCPSPPNVAITILTDGTIALRIEDPDGASDLDPVSLRMPCWASRSPIRRTS